MKHDDDCAWSTADCEYKETHEYCPHPEHACNCQPKSGGYRLHIVGPDDVHDYVDELEALRAANDINKQYLADREANPGAEVLFVATVSRVSE